MGQDVSTTRKSKRRTTMGKAYQKARRTSKPGEGKRFKALKEDLMRQGKSEESASAIAAAIGRRKYGKAKMAEWARKGKARRR